jgi:uncharacterized protein (DUF1330 family)
MSAYMVFNYSITNPDGYAPYGRLAGRTLAAHGAEAVVADYSSQTIEGAPGQVTVLLRFESREAALAWYESEEYQSVVHLRTDNSEGTAVLCDGFVMPS